MKILIINGSPRRKGNISQMLNSMAEEAMAQGAKVEMIEAIKLNVRPCIGCMRCRSSHECSLPSDDAQMVVEKIRQCDALVIGAPCYWGNMPGVLKVLFDRMVYAMMDETPRGIPIPLQKGKRCVLVSTSTTPWPINILFHQSRGVIRALKEICHYSGFKTVATIEKGGTRNNTTLSDRERKKCVNAIRKITAHS